ncbi:hypothetical protein MY3296_005310 [Beauveria thailandica]
MDLTQQVDVVSRSSKPSASGKPSRTIRLRQTFFPHHMLPTNAALWDALTKPERLATWFAPVSGGLRTNGRYSITGNASGVLRPQLRHLRHITMEAPLD